MIEMLQRKVCYKLSLSKILCACDVLLVILAAMCTVLVSAGFTPMLLYFLPLMESGNETRTGTWE